MESEEYRHLYELEETLWWFQGMRRITEALLERFGSAEPGLRILDAGCGTGGMLSLLRQHGAVVGVDLFEEAIHFAKRREGAQLVRGSILELPFTSDTFDLVTEFEVVNHWSIQNDQQAFNELARVLRPGGILLYREPAYPWLFAKHDRAVHTRHRYSADQLARLLNAAGLEPLYQGHANCFLFPVALVRRLLGNLVPGNQRSDVRQMPAPLNAALAWILSQEAKIIRHRRLPFGLSQIGVARRSH